MPDDTRKLRPFEEDLQVLSDELLEMGALVAHSVHKSVFSLLDKNEDFAHQVLRDEARVDQMEIQIDDLATSLIVREQPVARDMRFVVAAIKISTDLERMGDLAVNIAKAARRTAARRGPQTLYDLIQAQGNLVHRVLDACLEALEKSDLELARKLPDLDEPIDHLYKQFFRELARLQDEEDIEWASSMMLAARYLERIADHAVDIGERTEYMLTGTFEGPTQPPVAG